MICTRCPPAEDDMAVGRSNKIVVEIDIEVKRRLYAKLASKGITMKAWIEEHAERYLTDRNVQARLPLESDNGH